jgi:hypothetical protein
MLDPRVDGRHDLALVDGRRRRLDVGQRARRFGKTLDREETRSQAGAAFKQMNLRA